MMTMKTIEGGDNDCDYDDNDDYDGQNAGSKMKGSRATISTNRKKEINSSFKSPQDGQVSQVRKYQRITLLGAR